MLKRQESSRRSLVTSTLPKKLCISRRRRRHVVDFASLLARPAQPEKWKSGAARQMSRSPSAARWSPERRWDGARRLSDVLVYRLFFDLSPVNSRQTVARVFFVDFAAVEQTSSKSQHFEGDLRRRRPGVAAVAPVVCALQKFAFITPNRFPPKYSRLQRGSAPFWPRDRRCLQTPNVPRRPPHSTPTH